MATDRQLPFPSILLTYTPTLRPPQKIASTDYFNATKDSVAVLLRH